MKTCLNRLLGRCQNCTEDYDTTHHPNNYDCPWYKEVKILTHEIIEKEDNIKKYDIRH